MSLPDHGHAIDEDNPPSDDQEPPGSQCASGECEHYQQVVRLRRDLHDGLGPALAALVMRVDVIRSSAGIPSDVDSMLADLRAEAGDFIGEFRRVLVDRPPAELDGMELADALKVMADRFWPMTRGDLDIEIDVTPEVANVDRSTEIAACWIAREALTNVVKHAEAHTCTVRAWVDGGLWLEIIDDGVGGAGLRKRGNGMRSMHGRAAELGGWCEVADHGFGVTVRAFLPD